MPRTARKESQSGIYHVILRGINRQDIFEDELDYRFFVKTLEEVKAISEFELYAYCLMPNHIHLLLRVGGEPLDQVFRRIGTRFVYWYNGKYNRVGHLFQDRFRSEPVDNENYFCTVLRYIIWNPAKAGLERCPGNYPWSSYNDYKNRTDGLTDIDFAVQMLGSDEDILAFFGVETEEEVMDITPIRAKKKDEEVRDVMKKLTGCSSLAEFQHLGIRERMDAVAKMYSKHISMGQIARVTGMPKSSVHRAVRKMRNQGE